MKTLVATDDENQAIYRRLAQALRAQIERRTMNLAWDQTVDDGRFRCVVEQGETGYRGILKVTVVETGEVLLEQETTIGYAAIFGPDLDDVHAWQTASILAIDDWLADQ